MVFYLNRQRKQLLLTQRLLADKNKEIRLKNRQLREFLDIRDKLISVASHDLRSPLITLKNLLELFKDEDLTAEEFREAALMMEAQYERSLDMSDNLLLWVKPAYGIEPNKVVFDVVEVTEELK